MNRNKIKVESDKTSNIIIGYKRPLIEVGTGNYRNEQMAHYFISFFREVNGRDSCDMEVKDHINFPSHSYIV